MKNTEDSTLTDRIMARTRKVLDAATVLKGDESCIETLVGLRAAARNQAGL